MEQLLSTKFYIPPTRLKLVSRKRLVDRINKGLHRKLTLISAPAGFGKTTLVSEWVEQSRLENPNENNIGWLSLDESDNDPVRFLSYFITALTHDGVADADFGDRAISMLQSPKPPPSETILTALINDIADLPYPIILVIDDYHLISEEEIDDTLTFLLDHQPSQLHLIIATRVDPQLPLSRLRARDQLNELRATELRFTSSEAAEFLNEAMGLAISAEDLTALETRTEGWIAGLQLAAISMQGTKDTTSLIQSFTGSHRLVLDYLIEEVLEQQNEETVAFLLKTAVLKKLTGSLCDAISGQENGQATLMELEQANLFIIPLDNERIWYRHHHLFAELLEQRLKYTYPELIDDLHKKAAIWFENNGNLEEAIHHSFARNDYKTATRLIETGALTALERSNLMFIFRWIDRLPKTAMENSPWLYVYYCWALLISGQVDVAVPKLANTDWLLESISDDQKSKKQEMAGYIAGLKALLSSWKRDYQNGIDYANQALKNLPKNNWIRGYCAIVMGGTYWGNGKLQAAKDAFAESAAVGKASGNIMLEVSGTCNLAYSYELEGRLQQSLQIFQNTFQLTERNGKVLPVAGYIHVEIGRVFYEMNELDLARQHLVKGIKLCKRIADGRAERTGHYLLARVHLANGEIGEAVNSIQNGDRADSSPETTFDLRGGEFLQVRAWLKQNKLKDLETWLIDSNVDLIQISHFKLYLTHTMHARVMIHLSRKNPDSPYLEEALILLDDLLEKAESYRWGKKMIEILALRALCFQELGDPDQALTTLDQALNLAEPEGFFRIFVDEGPPMARLLYQGIDRGIDQEYARRLLPAFQDLEVKKDKSEISLSQVGIIEPLTNREIEVLQLITEGLTNQEIAERLVLSRNTVKAHTRNIFSKLDVSNRINAVGKAKTLGILPSN